MGQGKKKNWVVKEQVLHPRPERLMNLKKETSFSFQGERKEINQRINDLQLHNTNLQG